LQFNSSNRKKSRLKRALEPTERERERVDLLVMRGEQSLLSPLRPFFSSSREDDARRVRGLLVLGREGGVNLCVTAHKKRGQSWYDERERLRTYSTV